MRNRIIAMAALIFAAGSDHAAGKIAGTYHCPDMSWDFQTLVLRPNGTFQSHRTVFGGFDDDGTYRVEGKRLLLTSTSPERLKGFAIDILANGDLSVVSDTCVRVKSR